MIDVCEVDDVLSRHDAVVAWTDEFTAVGTVGAVVVALGIALAPMIWRALRKPRLTVVTGRGEPFLRPISENSYGIGEMRLRVGVRNQGKSTAHDVRAVLRNWWETNEDGNGWLELDTDPLPMKWVALRPGDDRVSEPPTTQIPPDSTEMLDLVIWRPDSIELLVDDRRQALYNSRRTPAIGTWRIHFELTGTNTTPTTWTVEFECDGKNFIRRVELSTPPQSARHVGLMRLLREITPDNDTE